MRILLFYGGYLPGVKYGGPVTSIYNFTELFGDTYELFLVCSNHDLKESTPYDTIHAGWNQEGKVKVMYLSDHEFSENRFLAIIDEVHPDLIYLSSLFAKKTSFHLLNIAKQISIPVLLAPRGELNDSALRRGALKKKAYLFLLRIRGILNAIYYQATSNEEKECIAHNLGIKENKIYLLPNVPSIAAKKEKIQKENGKLHICYVGRIVSNKNLLFAIKAINRASIEAVFDIYGPNEDKEYWELCKKAIDEAPKNVVVSYKGSIPPLKMRALYSRYDCLISPTHFENYGQAIVEAMLHDTPVIISKGTTPWDNINDFDVGFAIPLDEMQRFTEAIERIGALDCSTYTELVYRLREYCLKTFDIIPLKEKYIIAFEKITSIKKKGE